MQYPVVLVLLLLAPLAQAQLPSVSAATDPAWSPLLGCWELRSQSVNNVELDTPPGQLVCLKHVTGGPGVEVLAVEDGKLVPRDTFVADGVRRELSPVPPCRGWQEAVWSSDGERLYLSSELSCAEGPTRTSSAVSLLSVMHEWVEIRRLHFAERSQVAVRRFRPASPEASAALGMSPGGVGPLGVATALTLDDLLEASQRLEPEAVEALLLESGFRGRVDAGGLSRLAGTGVDDGIIDLVVALSYPDRFVIERGGMVVERLKEEEPRVVYSSSYVSAWPWWGYHGWSSWWYWYPVQPVPPPVGGTPPAARGRVVKGKGYTRARVIPAEGEGGGLGKAIAKSTGGKSSGHSTGSGSSSDSSSGGGTASSDGYSGSGSSGRKAVPRPKGDDR